METNQNRQGQSDAPFPEDFRYDPDLANRYPDDLFAEKHACAAENLKKFGLPRDLPKGVPSPSMQKKSSKGKPFYTDQV